MAMWNTEGIIEPEPEEVIEVPEGHYLELGDGAVLSNVVVRGKPDHVGEYGDGFPGCLLLAWAWLRSLLWEAWRNSGEMCDPENYLEEK